VASGVLGGTSVSEQKALQKLLGCINYLVSLTLVLSVCYNY